MLEISLWVAVGCFVGWNFPQPAYAVAIQEYFRKLFTKTVETLDKDEGTE